MEKKIWLVSVLFVMCFGFSVLASGIAQCADEGQGQIDKRRLSGSAGDRWIPANADGANTFTMKGYAAPLGEPQGEPAPSFKEVDFEEPTFEKLPNGTERIIIKASTGKEPLYYAEGVPGSPRLPVLPFKLLVADERDVMAFKVQPQELTPVAGTHRIECVQQPYPIGEEAKITEPDPEVYNSDVPVPAYTADNPMVQTMKGYDIALLTACPIAYKPASGEVSYYKKMKVELVTSARAAEAAPLAEGGAVVPSRLGPRGRSDDMEKVKEFVDNWDQTGETYTR